MRRVKKSELHVYKIAVHPHMEESVEKSLDVDIVLYSDHATT